MDIRNRAVLVTGASRGLGAALLSELARRGARVVGVARGRAALPSSPPGPRARAGRSPTRNFRLYVPDAKSSADPPFRRRATAVPGFTVGPGESFEKIVWKPSSPTVSVRNCFRPPNMTPFTFATSGFGPTSTSFPSKRGSGAGGPLRCIRSDIEGTTFYTSRSIADRTFHPR